ncbi:hypothetical protein, partial [Streptomyces netropsis]
MAAGAEPAPTTPGGAQGTEPAPAPRAAARTSQTRRPVTGAPVAARPGLAGLAYRHGRTGGGNDPGGGERPGQAGGRVQAGRGHGGRLRT